MATPTKIRDPRQRLDLGTDADGWLDLMSRDGKRPGKGYFFEVSVDGIEWGTPEAERIIVASLLQDGDDERTVRHANKSTKFLLRITGDDPKSLGEGERDLALHIGKRRLMRWTPPEEGPVTEFVVMTSDMEPNTTGKNVLNRESVWALEFRCMPWNRSPVPFTDTLTPGSGTVVTKADGTSLTDWSASGMNLSLVTHLTLSAIEATYVSGEEPWVQWAGNIGTTNFIWIDMAAGPSLGGSVIQAFAAGGIVPTPPSAIQVMSNGYTRYFFVNPNPGGGVKFKISTSGPVYIDGIGSSTTIPATGMLLVTPKGSMRTPASLVVGQGSAVGDVMVYTDPTMLECGWNPDDYTTWQNAPAGTYVVYAKVAASPVPTATVYTATVGTQVGRTSLPAAPTAGEWFPVDKLHIGNLRTGRLGTVGIPTVDNVGGVADVNGTRIFRMADDTSLTYVKGLTAELTIDIPSIEHPYGGVWSNGVSVADEADTWGWGIFTPPATPVWVWSSLVTDLTCTSTYYALWRLFAGL